jgi:hypothetical protein
MPWPTQYRREGALRGAGRSEGGSRVREAGPKHCPNSGSGRVKPRPKRDGAERSGAHQGAAKRSDTNAPARARQCAERECTNPVVGGNGDRPALYCSIRCRNRSATRKRAEQREAVRLAKAILAEGGTELSEATDSTANHPLRLVRDPSMEDGFSLSELDLFNRESGFGFVPLAEMPTSVRPESMLSRLTRDVPPGPLAEEDTPDDWPVKVTEVSLGPFGYFRTASGFGGIPRSIPREAGKWSRSGGYYARGKANGE